MWGWDYEERYAALCVIMASDITNTSSYATHRIRMLQKFSEIVFLVAPISTF